MDRERIRRHAAILESFAAVRSPEEGFLVDEDYATLIETLLDTRGGCASDDEIFAVVRWADDTALRSRILELIIRGEKGLDLDTQGEIMLTEAPPAHLRTTAADRIPAASDPGDLGTINVRLAFAAGRLDVEQPWTATELARVEAWAQAAAADRALLDLILAYPDLGLDVSQSGRVVVLPAGPAA